MSPEGSDASAPADSAAAVPSAGLPTEPPKGLSGENVPSHLHFEILPQPDDSTCGPTCLHAVYRYFRDGLPLAQVIDEVQQLETGGTLAALLGVHALRRGYKARIYTFDLTTFDPTWIPLEPEAVIQKLTLQMVVKTDAKHRAVSRAYTEFLRLGGSLRTEDLTRSLVRRYLNRDVPIIAGLSSTYLYRSMRDIPETNTDDDIRGEPGGHFVVLHGYNPEARTVLVADPCANHPFEGTHRYEAPIDRVVCAILLGVVTYDANLLIVEPRVQARKRATAP
jgi:hypothetical protein